MKNQRQVTNFTCDQCGNKSDQRTIEQGFPYDEGWEFLFKLATKVEKHQRKVTREKHFCCNKCTIEFVTTALKGGKNMPITRKQFEAGNFNKRSAPGEDNYVLEFLKKDGKAYTVDEISKAVKRGGAVIRKHLRDLVKKGLVLKTS